MASLSPRFGDALTPEAAAAARALGRRAWASDFYLAGSAALALYLGHRRVGSLDWMTAGNRLASPDRRDLLADLLALDPGARVETARDGYLAARFSPGERALPVAFYHYPYPLIDPLERHAGAAVASAVDLGLMKLGAVISRGTRRDFVDLHLLCRELPLAELLERSAEKFGHVRDFELQALKGLSDLSATDGEPMPRLEVPVDWRQVEAWVASEVRRLGREKVGLSAGAAGSEG